MPPSVALVLCIAFVAYLFRLDQRHTRDVTRSLWVPTLWLIYCASRPLAVWLGQTSLNEGDANVEAGSPVDRAFSTLLMVVSVVIVARRRLNWSQVFRDNTWLFLLFAYMGLSIVWSDYSFVSFKRWIRACGSITMALVILTEPSAREGLESVIRRSVYFLIPFSALLVKYYSLQGQDYNIWTGETMWVGITPQKNCLGRLCLLSAFFLFWEFSRTWRQGNWREAKQKTVADAVVFLMVLWLLIGSHSATSLAVLMVGMGTFFALVQFREYLKTASAMIEVSVVVLIVVVSMAYLIFGDLVFSAAVGTLGRDMTFTGRTEIWKLLIPIAKNHPVLGMGYGSFWIHPQLPWPGLNEGHNGYLDVALELGGVGLVLLGAFFIWFYRSARQALSQSFDWAAFNICFLLMAVIHNCTESSFVRSTTHLWTFMIFLSVVSARLYRPADEAEENCPEYAEEGAQAEPVAEPGEPGLLSGVEDNSEDPAYEGQAARGSYYCA
jgi:exopolysaccharide production protein ExoQ